MSLRVALFHRIERNFDRHVRLSTHWLRLRPAPHVKAEVEAYSLRVKADSHFLNWLRDPFENHLARLDFPDPLKQFALETELLLQLTAANPFDFLLDPEGSHYPVSYTNQLRKELAPYLRTGRLGPDFESWIKRFPRKQAYIVDFLSAVNLEISTYIACTGGTQPGATDCEAVLRRRCAGPWDLAWLATLTLRALGLAARLTCGYRVLIAQNEQQADLAGLHAWTEVFLPGAGWIGLDPAGGIFTNETYVPLASAPDPLRTVPVAGYWEACQEQTSEHVQLRRVQPPTEHRTDPSVSWKNLISLGCAVDDELAARGIGLSTGAELAFVSASNANAPEWSTATLGLEKFELAQQLAVNLARRLASGALLHQGQGKTFAGEGAPRWRLLCLFRENGQKIWKGATAQAIASTTGNNCSQVDANEFAANLVGRLELPSGCLIPAYEDRLHDLSVNGALCNYRPTTDELSDPAKRRALADHLSSVPGQPVGYVIPLRWDYVNSRWSSGKWQFRRGALHLMPGNSSMGFRLPLDSLAVSEHDAVEPQLERSPFEDRPADPTIHGETTARHSTYTAPQSSFDIADGRQALPAPRTALCVELRADRLHVFVPPLSHLEHYLALISAINATAEQLSVAVSLEGYEPAEDPRVRRLELEPDAGILRVRLPQTSSWDQQSTVIRWCYEEAEKLGLSPARKLADGSCVPPGGGVSITLGSDLPAESPFLRRPELLKKLISYWQRHPSLSYFFCNGAIGPGGIAPRPDEGRDDALYELGIALERIPPGLSDHPWLADRLLRHLMADPAGNMQRAEIDLSYLYPPHRQSERLGRIALRGFEMRSNPHGAALQVLLTKALVALLERSPQVAPLADWGATLHDRFMLPHALWRDMREILSELSTAGIPFDELWFSDVLDETLPVLGRAQLGEIGLQLRQAHEPWPVLAEEIAGGNVVRFVDTSTQRIEVKISGLAPDRYVLSCNGRYVPLQATSVQGEYVAGVRFKAWNPISTLHPTRPAILALVFDLIDTWRGRSLGGCSYFPKRPEVWGTVSYRSQPVAPGLHPPAHLPPQLLNTAPWTAKGQFTSRAGSAQHVTAPVAFVDTRQPYLLDLLR